MGYELRRALREALGPDITGLQRALALEIADDANNKTRESWAKLEDLVRWTGAKDADVIRNALKRLAAAGWEFRVPLGVGKDGRVLYAVPGKRLTFRVPPFEGVAAALLEGGAPATPLESKGEQGLTENEPGLPIGGAGARSEGVGATPFSSCSSEVSSSLSADPPVTAASQDEGEREDLTEDERQELVHEVDQFTARLMAEHAATAEEVAAVLAAATQDKIRSLPAWAKSSTGKDDFARRLSEHRARAAFAADRVARRSTCGHSGVLDPDPEPGWGNCLLCNIARRRAAKPSPVVAEPEANGPPDLAELMAGLERARANQRDKIRKPAKPIPEPAIVDRKTFARIEAELNANGVPPIALDQEGERASA